MSTPGSPGPVSVGAGVAEALLNGMRRELSVAGRLHLLDEAEGAQPDLVQHVGRLLSDVSEQEVMFDDGLKLMRLWYHHRMGQAAEREYYLHAMPRASDRAEIRRALGISAPSGIEQLVLLITVDCMRGGQLSCNGYSRPTTPGIDALASGGVNFPAAYSTAGQTAQSFPGILMSNYFQNFGRSRSVPEHLVTLAEALSANGFSTTAYNAANPHISHFYGYDKGFDRYEDFLGGEVFDHVDETFVDNSPRRLAPPSERDLMAVFEDCQAHPDVYETLCQLTGLRDLPLIQHIARRERFYPYNASDLVKGAIADVLAEDGNARRFCWLHLMDLHENITIPFSRLGSFSAAQRFFLNTLLASPLGVEVLRPYAGKYRELYDSAVSYVDINVEVLANFLGDHGLLGRSLICLTGDHGQELLERGVFGHGYDRLVERLVHVPLVFGGGLANRIDPTDAARPVSTLDIAPTVLDVCGIEDAPDTFLGRTLGDRTPRPLYGQTFYEGADNRCSDRSTRAFELKPFPEPVRECCAMMVYCIQDGHQVIHDSRTGVSEVHRLAAGSAAGAASQPPDPERVTQQALDYFECAYAPPDEGNAFELAPDDKRLVASRLHDLGYL